MGSKPTYEKHYDAHTQRQTDHDTTRDRTQPLPLEAAASPRSQRPSTGARSTTPRQTDEHTLPDVEAAAAPRSAVASMLCR